MTNKKVQTGNSLTFPPKAKFTIISFNPFCTSQSQVAAEICFSRNFETTPSASYLVAYKFRPPQPNPNLFSISFFAPASRQKKNLPNILSQGLLRGGSRSDPCVFISQKKGGIRLPAGCLNTSWLRCLEGVLNFFFTSYLIFQVSKFEPGKIHFAPGSSSWQRWKRTVLFFPLSILSRRKKFFFYSPRYENF